MKFESTNKERIFDFHLKDLILCYIHTNHIFNKCFCLIWLMFILCQQMISKIKCQVHLWSNQIFFLGDFYGKVDHSLYG